MTHRRERALPWAGTLAFICACAGGAATGPDVPGAGGASTGGAAGAEATVGTGGAVGAGGAVGTGGRGGASPNPADGGGASGGEADARDAAVTDASAPDLAADRAPAALEPARGALLGAFVGAGTLAQLETSLRRRIAVVHHFVGWSDDFMVQVRADLGGDRIPLITWEAWMGGVGTPLGDIVAGAHDTMIRARAQAAKDTARPFFLRWGHEMNGNWYPWDGFHNGANAAATARYVAAYRHIHDLFTAAGASNVVWIFSPNADTVPPDAWNQWPNYYPGDDYVDWMGFDGYNWGTTQPGSTWQSFAAIAARIYPALAQKGKPIIVPETACAEVGGDKAAWIAAVLPALQTSFPAIKAFLWFDMNKETDWRIASSPQALSTFVTMGLDAYLNP